MKIVQHEKKISLLKMSLTQFMWSLTGTETQELELLEEEDPAVIATDNENEVTENANDTDEQQSPPLTPGLDNGSTILQTDTKIDQPASPTSFLGSWFANASDEVVADVIPVASNNENTDVPAATSFFGSLFTSAPVEEVPPASPTTYFGSLFTSAPVKEVPPESPKSYLGSLFTSAPVNEVPPKSPTSYLGSLFTRAPVEVESNQEVDAQDAPLAAPPRSFADEASPQLVEEMKPELDMQEVAISASPTSYANEPVSNLLEPQLDVQQVAPLAVPQSTKDMEPQMDAHEAIPASPTSFLGYFFGNAPAEQPVVEESADDGLMSFFGHIMGQDDDANESDAPVAIASEPDDVKTNLGLLADQLDSPINGAKRGSYTVKGPSARGVSFDEGDAEELVKAIESGREIVKRSPPVLLDTKFKLMEVESAMDKLKLIQAETNRALEGLAMATRIDATMAMCIDATLLTRIDGPDATMATQKSPGPEERTSRSNPAGATPLEGIGPSAHKSPDTSARSNISNPAGATPSPRIGSRASVQSPGTGARLNIASPAAGVTPADRLESRPNMPSPGSGARSNKLSPAPGATSAQKVGPQTSMQSPGTGGRSKKLSPALGANSAQKIGPQPSMQSPGTGERSNKLSSVGTAPAQRVGMSTHMSPGSVARTNMTNSAGSRMSSSNARPERLGLPKASSHRILAELQKKIIPKGKTSRRNCDLPVWKKPRVACVRRSFIPLSRPAFSSRITDFPVGRTLHTNRPMPQPPSRSVCAVARVEAVSIPRQPV